MVAPDGSNMVVGLGLFIFLLATMAVIFYWAATTENNMENNPDE